MYKFCVGLVFLVVLCCNNPMNSGTGENCENNPNAGINQFGEFYNYISLHGKVFRDGCQDFYPMIMNYSIDLVSETSLSGTDLFATPRSTYHPFYGEEEGELKSPWGSDSTKIYSIIQH